jgi:hypothetical protein
MAMALLYHISFMLPRLANPEVVGETKAIEWQTYHAHCHIPITPES